MAERRTDDRPDSLTDVLAGVETRWKRPLQSTPKPVDGTDEDALEETEREGEEVAVDPSSDEMPADEVPAGDEPATETPPRDDVQLTEAQHAQLQAATRRMHEATQEAAAERRRVAALEGEKAQILADLEALRAAEHDRQAAKEAVPPFDAKAHMKAAYKRAAAIELDPAAEDYEARMEQQQDIIADAQAEIFERATRQPSLTEAQVRELARTEAEQAAVARQAQQSEEAETSRVFNLLLTTAKQAGLEVDTPTDANVLGGRHYNDLVTVAQTPKLYVAEGQEQTVEDQISAIVSYVQQRHGMTANGNTNGQRATPPESVRVAQARNTPMERSGTGRAAAARTQEAEDAQPLTLDQALQQTQGRRRV